MYRFLRPAMLRQVHRFAPTVSVAAGSFHVRGGFGSTPAGCTGSQDQDAKEKHKPPCLWSKQQLLKVLGDSITKEQQQSMSKAEHYQKAKEMNPNLTVASSRSMTTRTPRTLSPAVQTIARCLPPLRVQRRRSRMFGHPSDADIPTECLVKAVRGASYTKTAILAHTRLPRSHIDWLAG
jgi:hypothetical protein